MADAPDLTTSKVRLWDRLQSDYNVGSGDGLVLHPETELSAIVMTTGGGIVSSSNQLSLNASSAWVSGLSGIVAESYCPLSKTVEGNTQYADMYTSNGSAVVSNVQDGDLQPIWGNYKPVTSVGMPPIASGSSCVPTELAVANALATRQQVLSGGDCIVLSAGSSYTAIGVSAQHDTPLPQLSAALQTRIPTEYVVRHAIDVGDEATSNYAYDLTSALSISIQQAGYATSAWCLNTFLQKGETPEPGPGGSWGYATEDSAGVVLPYASGGLSVSAGGSLSLDIATTSTLGGVKCGTGLSMSGTSADYIRLRVASGNAIGGVMVPSGSGLSLNSTTGSLVLSGAPVGDNNITYASAVAKVGSNAIGGVYVMNHVESATTAVHKSKAVVPTVDAVWSAIDTAKCPHTFTSGLTENSTTHVVTLDSATTAALGGIIVGSGLEVSSGTVDLTSADYATFGGVIISDSMGIGITDGVVSVTAAPVEATYAAAFAKEGSGTIGGVVVMSSIESTADPYAKGASIVPTVQAVYDYVSAQGGGGGGGKPISSGGGITVTDNTTSYTLTLNRAGTTSATYGGVYVPSGSGLGLITAAGTSQGKLYLSSATSNALGGVKVPNNSGLSLTNGSLKLSSATTTSIGGVIVPTGSGIQVQNGNIGLSAAPFAPSYESAATMGANGSFGGVMIMSSLDHAYDASTSGTAVVPTVNAVYSAIANADAAYKGPFAVKSSGPGATTSDMYVNVSAGYVKWLDGNVLVTSAEDRQLDAGSFMYLAGSSGAVAGETITANSYQVSVKSGSTTRTYTRTTSNAVNSRYKWTSGTGSMYTPDFVPTTGTLFYTTSNGTTAWGSATAYNYNITVGGVVYSKTQDDTMNTDGWYNSGAVKYTSGPWPAVNDKTLYAISSSFAYTTTTPSLPPAGAFYTMLAENSGGTVKQHQYGTVWHEHWGDDYKGQFAISRVARTTTLSATIVPAIGAHPYRFIVANGGRLYGGMAFNKGRIWGGMPVSGGIIMAPGDVMYPTVSVPNTGTVTGSTYNDAATSSTVNDGLYFPYGATGEVWMNIWSGTWPVAYGGTDQTAVTSTWWTVAHSQCLEGYIPNCYSVQLGWLTPNGAPQQEHKGAISIRGRWA